MFWRRLWRGTGAAIAIAGVCANAADAAALSTPAMSGSLVANPSPTQFDAGPLGDIYVTGAVSGVALWQDNRAAGDRQTRIDLDNGQVFIQKTDGWFQFYVEAGAYSLPSLGTAYLKAGDAPAATYGIVPQAYVKLVPSDDVSIEIGKLPTLIGNEYNFTFENMNVERGLLWNQTPSVSRGVQVNYSSGPFSAAVSWNDGYYSNRFNWFSGSLAYAIDGSNSVSAIGGSNFGRTAYSGSATPLAQNNGSVYNLIYSHTSGPWTISPYIQYATVPADAALGTAHSASTISGALLASYGFNDNWKLGARAEYISASGSAASGAPNLLYGQGSKAWSLTLTPTYQRGIFFARAEASYVGVADAVAGSALGAFGLDKSQARVLFETGVLF
ncbi:MAG TPA: outer membrane beta-barrel protein [Rhizomicrobium sp.]|nr:outer membrane beta-barrel protein [Rhizomicrobium sp.]